MFIKYNISNVKRERRMIDVVSCDVALTSGDTHCLLTFTTKTPHNLNEGDIILFNRDIEKVKNYSDAIIRLNDKPNHVVYAMEDDIVIIENIKGEFMKYEHPKGYYWKKQGKVKKVPSSDLNIMFDKYNSINDKLTVSSLNLTKYTFSIRYKCIKDFYVQEVFDGKESAVVYVSGNTPVIYDENESFIIKKRVYRYVYEREETWGDNFIETDVNPYNKSEYLGAQTVKYLGKVYSWKPQIDSIPCKFIKENYFSYKYDDEFDINKKYYIQKNEAFEMEDVRFIDKNGKLHKDLTFYEFNEVIDIPISLSCNNGNDLNNEDICKSYFNSKKKELVPDIIDYEKRCFTPYYIENNENNLVTEINFNLFFRERDKESKAWNTNDAMGWNQYKINSDGSFNENSVITNGDLIGSLDFTDDDIYFRKKKVSKSFLRLSFYSSNNPLNQMLLYYSTIFLDSGELYTKYMKNINKKIMNGQEYSLVNDNSLGDNNLTVSFKVNDRYTLNKSSEGFYLYLFPDGINDGEERTVYMKAEFNHAGYGKTIPLIYPNNGEETLTFGDDGFPTSLLDNNGSLKEYYRQLYVPVTIKYDAKMDEYLYRFNICDRTDNKITLNLFEPKINSLT